VKPAPVGDFRDPLWRLENFYYIVDKKGHKRLFKRNNVQRLASEFTQKRRRYLKSRQMGISTFESLRLLDYTMFTPNVTTCIIAHEQDAIEKLFRIPRRAYNFMHPDIKPQIDKGGGSKYEMFFPEINSRIYCDLESRGDTIHRLHISEHAFIKDYDRVLATLEAVPIEGHVTIESTPNGIANDFYDGWMDEESNYTNIFLPWFLHTEEYVIQNHELTPKSLTKEEKEFIVKVKKLFGHDITLDQIAFRRFKQRELKGKFGQEYPEDDVTCFLTSGGTPFDLTIIKPMYDKAQKPIDEVNGWRIYKRPTSNGIYVCGADTAEGVEGDSSCGQIFDVITREQVAVFHSNTVKPSEFAESLDFGCRMYSTRDFPILLAVERNNHGHAVLMKLDEFLDYPNLFKAPDEKLGWKTDKVTRPIMVDVFIEGVENKTVILNDKKTLGECLTLVNKNGKIEAEEGKHDDHVIAASIAIQLCLEEARLQIYDGIGSKIKV